MQLITLERRESESSRAPPPRVRLEPPASNIMWQRLVAAEPSRHPVLSRPPTAVGPPSEVYEMLRDLGYMVAYHAIGPGCSGDAVPPCAHRRCRHQLDLPHECRGSQDTDIVMASRAHVQLPPRMRLRNSGPKNDEPPCSSSVPGGRAPVTRAHCSLVVCQYWSTAPATAGAALPSVNHESRSIKGTLLVLAVAHGPTKLPDS